jgi:protein phosphatase
MRIDITAQTDVGRRKRHNEDHYGVFREDSPGLALFKDGALLCVADGLGGHLGGEIASKLAVSFMKDLLKQPPPPQPADPETDQGPLPLICEWITRANNNIFQTNRDLLPDRRPMGTTILAAVVTPRKVYIGNVGDTRCYHIRDGEIIAKTEDHSWVDEQVRLGLMSKAEAESDTRRNVVTRSIGTHPDVVVDTYLWHVVPGDMLLLCSDGLVNMVKDSEILTEFKKRGAMAEIAQRLVNLANEKGGMDNITVLIAHLSPNALRLAGRRLAAFWRRRRAHILWALLCALVGAACFAAGYHLGVGAK